MILCDPEVNYHMVRSSPRICGGTPTPASPGVRSCFGKGKEVGHRTDAFSWAHWTPFGPSEASFWLPLRLTSFPTGCCLRHLSGRSSLGMAASTHTRVCGKVEWLTRKSLPGRRRGPSSQECGLISMQLT